MKCPDASALLAALADGELDAVQSDVVERHLMDCPACAGEFRRLTQLRARVRDEAEYFRAPRSLRARVTAALAQPAADGPAASRAGRQRWRWLGWGALAGSLVTAGALFLATATTTVWQGDHDLAEKAVAAHVRATLGGHLLEVASSDRHTVRPWLSARLDYAVPVADWTPSGFPLAGARIDRLDGRAVATLVYRQRAHVIDVFVRPATPGARTPAMHVVRGFNVAAATGAGMEWIAASDLNDADLSTFVQGLARGAVAPAPQ